MSTPTPEAGPVASTVDPAAELGLADYQYSIYRTLLANPDNKIPREVLPIIARWLDRVDFGMLLVGREEVMGIIGRSSPQTLRNYTREYRQWLQPLVAHYKDPLSPPTIELWLRAKAEGFARWQAADEVAGGPADPLA
jgi:hypothetical protein